MAGSYNKIILIGNVGRDPDARYTPNGDNVTEFSVATSERRRGADGQQQEQTTWFRVSAWGKLGETCNQFLHKGSYVYVEGSLIQREYTDREGTTRFSLDVRAREMRMLDKRGEGGGFGDDQGAANSGDGPDGGGRDASTRPAQNAPPTNPDADMGDIPF